MLSMSRQRHRGRRVAQIALASALALPALPGVAAADRAATPKERRAIGGSARCLNIRISTVSTRWAKLTATNRSGCGGADGFQLLRKTNGQWIFVVSGPSVSDPCDAGNAYPKVPVRVQRDLGLCDG